jgi:proteasome assembly chaperone (PAC2) family protein
MIEITAFTQKMEHAQMIIILGEHVGQRRKEKHNLKRDFVEFKQVFNKFVSPTRNFQSWRGRNKT